MSWVPDGKETANGPWVKMPATEPCFPKILTEVTLVNAVASTFPVTIPGAEAAGDPKVTAPEQSAITDVLSCVVASITYSVEKETPSPLGDLPAGRTDRQRRTLIRLARQKK